MVLMLAAAGTAGTYPHMQLVLAALGLLLTRTQAYLSGPLAAGLMQGAQRLAAVAQQQDVNTAEVRGQRSWVCPAVCAAGAGHVRSRRVLLAFCRDPCCRLHADVLMLP